MVAVTVTLIALATQPKASAAAHGSTPGPVAAHVSTPVPAATEPSPDPIWTVPVAHTAGLLLGMRLSLSVIWPDAYDPFPVGRSARQYRRAWTAPPEYHSDRSPVESDGDPWVINIVGHGLFGTEVYGRVRQCHGSWLAALLFTAAASTFWEYGPEAFHKRPSAVDLTLTPLIGAILGEGRYQLQRALQRRPRTTTRRLLQFLIDPLGEGERTLLHTRC